MENKEIIIKQNEIDIMLDVNKNLSELENFNNLEAKVEYELKNIINNYISLGGYFNEILDKKFYELYEKKDLYSYVKEKFNLSETLVKNLISVYKKFGEEKCNYEYIVKEEFKEYSFSQLVELINVDEEKLIDYKPEMSVKEMRIEKNIESFEKQFKENIENNYLNK